MRFCFSSRRFFIEIIPGGFVEFGVCIVDLGNSLVNLAVFIYWMGRNYFRLAFLGRSSAMVGGI